MSNLINLLRSVSVATLSPSEAVEVTMDGQGTIDITLSGHAIEGHTEKSLAEEIEETVRQCRSDYADEFRAVRTAYREATNPMPDAKPTRSTIEKKREYINALTDIKSEARSSRGFVTAVAYGDGDLIVNMKSGLLSRGDINLRDIEGEVKEAVISVIRQLKRQKSNTHRSSYGSVEG